jgi:hypothetical protein
MREYILVEFLFTQEEHPDAMDILKRLGDDFQMLNVYQEWDYEDPSDAEFYYRVSGRINSMTASVIKLQHPMLAGKMRVSYIPDELKDKYRR